MAFDAGRKQERQFNAVTGNLTHKIILGKKRADNPKLFAVALRFFTLFRAGAQSKQHEGAEKQSKNVFHRCPHGLFVVIF